MTPKGARRPVFAHNSSAYPFLRRPNPVSPYTLLVMTSYVATAPHVYHDPLIVFQDRPRAVCHQRRRRPLIRKLGLNSRFLRVKQYIAIRIGPFHSNPQLSTKFVWLVAQASFRNNVTAMLISLCDRSLTRTWPQGDAKLSIRCTRRRPIRIHLVQTSPCPQPSRLRELWRTAPFLGMDGSIR